MKRQEKEIITEHGQAYIQQITVWRITCLICKQSWSKEWNRPEITAFMKNHEYRCNALRNGEWEE